MEFIKTLAPLFLIIVLFTAAFLMMYGEMRYLPAKWLFGIALSSLILLSFPPFSKILMWGLERKYPPLVNIANIEKIPYIVILSDWDSDVPTVPYTSNIGHTSAHRVLEAHRIHRWLLNCKIINSGKKTSCDNMIKLFLSLGVPRDHITSEDECRSTWESSVNVKNMLPAAGLFL